MAERVSNAAATAARRRQIIDATIETVAERGLAQTSFTQIAGRGGLSSTRLISYHFAGKEALIRAVVDHIYRTIDEFLLERIRLDPASRPVQQPPDLPVPEPATSAGEELRAYVHGTVAYIDSHRTQMRALQAIFAANHAAGYDPAAQQADPSSGVMTHLQQILRRGQQQGEFRGFDPLVVAAMVQRPLEALPQLLTQRPDLDLDAYAAELSAAIEHATRAAPGSPGAGLTTRGS